MSDDPVRNERAGKTGTKKSRHDDGTWAVEYSEKDRAFTVKVLDYHAGPLKITLDELAGLTGKAAPATAAPVPAAPATAAPAAAARQGREPMVGISRKEKSLYIAVPEGWSGLLKITRKELYQYGKMMGKRSRRHR